MRQLAFKVAVVSGFLFAGQFSYAGGCRLKDVTPSKALASRYLATQIRDKVIAIETEMAKRGQSLKAVLIGRMGESMSGFDVIKDDPNRPLQEYVDYLDGLAEANAQGRLRTSSGKVIPKSNGPRVPDMLLREEKLKYSHFGILVKQNSVDPSANDWVFVIHLLAECDTETNRYADSEIFFQTFDQFFWDTKMLKKENNRALVVVLKPEIQERLVRLLNDEKIGEQGLHEPNYNVAAVPFTLRDPDKKKKPAPDFHQLKDQNSNQWPLEMIAAASRPYGEIVNRRQAQDQLMRTNYRPTLAVPTGLKESMACSLRKGPFKIWDASNLLNCKDQVYRHEGIVQLITVDSLLDYFSRNKMLADNVDQAGKPGIYEVVTDKATLENLDEAGKVIEKAVKDAADERAQQDARAKKSRRSRR